MLRSGGAVYSSEHIKEKKEYTIECRIAPLYERFDRIFSIVALPFNDMLARNLVRVETYLRPCAHVSVFTDIKKKNEIASL